MSKIVYNSDTKIEIHVNEKLKKARKGEYTTYPIEKIANKLMLIGFYGILTAIILTICKIKNFPTTFYMVFTIISFVVFFIGVYIMCIIDEDRNGTFEIQDFLNKLKNKKIFLFGTAGYGESEKYFEGIINNVKKNIDSSNTIIGTFMCQGKMPLSVRKRYEKMREQNNISLNIDKLIANFDKALSHPNKEDLKTLEQIVILYEEE